jgi:antitoxin MazE
MKAAIHRIGNSRGVILPKALLAQLGLTNEVEMEIEQDAIVLRKPHRVVREGWAEASKAIAAAGEDVLIWPEFPNEDDAQLEW